MLTDGTVQADAVTCCDVLERIFVSDVPAVLRDILSLADRLAGLNVACYKANALLRFSKGPLQCCIEQAFCEEAEQWLTSGCTIANRDQ